MKYHKIFLALALCTAAFTCGCKDAKTINDETTLTIQTEPEASTGKPIEISQETSEDPQAMDESSPESPKEDGETAAAPAKETSESAALDEPEDGEGAEKEVPLSDAETLFFTDFIQEFENYGFILSDYDAPEDVNLDEVFYSGAGFGEAISDEELPYFLDLTGQESLETDCISLPAKGIDEFLLKK